MIVALLVVALAAGFVTTRVLGGEEGVAGASPAGGGDPALSGVPQDGFTLGVSHAPVTATVYTYLGAYDGGLNRALPELVEDYVRPGKVKVQLRTLMRDPEGVSFSEDSGPAAAQAAGLQNRLWPFYRLLTARHPGYLDADLVQAVAADVPGLDRRRWIADVRSRRVADAVRRGEEGARDAGVRSAPTVVLSVGGERVSTLPFTDARALHKALDAALARSLHAPSAERLKAALRCPGAMAGGCLTAAG